MSHRIGVLLSGRGSNFEAIAESVAAGRIAAEIAVVISNKVDAGGLDAARRRGIPALAILYVAPPKESSPTLDKEVREAAREQHDRAIAAALQAAGVDLVILAGYMRLISPWLVQQFPQRILNIHPSLLPAFPGLDAQQQAFDYGVKFSGCTVHFVDEHLDHGVIILQKVVPVLAGDDAPALAARILEQEHLAYAEAINLVLGGKFEVVGRRVVAKSSV